MSSTEWGRSAPLVRQQRLRTKCRGRSPVRPLRSLRSLAAACVVVLDPRAELEQVLSTIGALGGILDVMLELMQLADGRRARLRIPIDLERGVVRGMRAFRRGSCASRAGSVSGGCWVGGGWVSVCNRYNVVGGEQRRELDDRHDLDVPGLEVWYVAGRESVRAVVGVVCGLCVCVVLERRACGGGVCATPN